MRGTSKSTRVVKATLHHSHEVVQINQLQVQRLGARLDAGALQHIVHHFQQDGAVFANLLQLAARLGPIGADGLTQKLGKSQDGG